MSTWGLLLILVSLGAATASFIWLAFELKTAKAAPKKPTVSADDFTQAAELDVEHIFNEEFREELKNRGRLHFEKIIGENAMFLQQDLRLTTSQLNEYMKTEITQKLQEEFAKYEQSITDAKELALESINKTQEAIEHQREVMGEQLIKQIDEEKKHMVQRFEDNLADIVNHYVLLAIGDQIDLNDQLDFILSDLEANKEALLQDLKNGV